jgi:hypothetical protein
VLKLQPFPVEILQPRRTRASFANTEGKLPRDHTSYGAVCLSGCFTDSQSIYLFRGTAR